MPKKLLITLQIKAESDAVLARRRARQVALLLGFDSANQTRISTAVSEITRNAFVHAKGGRLDFFVDDSKSPYLFGISLSDDGPGIADIDAILSGNTVHVGLLGASRLVDEFEVETKDKGGTTVHLRKYLTARSRPFSAQEIDEIANSLTKLVATNPMDELHQQNQELLEALDELAKKQAMLDSLNIELNRTNEDLNSLNTEMQILNDSLEFKVQERTAELLRSNSELEKARDEAILANTLKSQFVSNISHEIRTPMSGILSGTELLLETSQFESEAQELLQTVHYSAKSLMTIINDLLDFAKLEAGKPRLEETTFSLNTLVDTTIEAVSGAARRKQLPIYKNIDADLSGNNLIGDAELIKRILLNLLHNAVKFTHDGKVSVDVKILNNHNDGFIMKSKIIDTGIGVADEDRDRLFHPFVQADGSNTRMYGGTGLGLSISKGYVELMGGEIGFSSKINEGSEFWFQVPVRMAKS